MTTFQNVGVKYAVLTTRHISGFCLRDSKVTHFDVANSPFRTFDNKSYYLPFEYEITSQRCDSLSLGNGLMKGSVWFTFPQSHFYPVDSLYKYIKQSFDHGGSTILLSTAPDMTGSYSQANRDSLIKLGKLINRYVAPKSW